MAVKRSPRRSLACKHTGASPSPPPAPTFVPPLVNALVRTVSLHPLHSEQNTSIQYKTHLLDSEMPETFHRESFNGPRRQLPGFLLLIFHKSRVSLSFFNPGIFSSKRFGLTLHPRAAVTVLSVYFQDFGSSTDTWLLRVFPPRPECLILSRCQVTHTHRYTHIRLGPSE